MNLVAGIDAGTQSLKVVVYDPATRGLVATASMPLELISGDDGSREQDINQDIIEVRQKTHQGAFGGFFR